MTNKKKSIIFINQSSGYLMIDIINAHAPYYDELILLTGYFNPRNISLNPKVKIIFLKNYVRDSFFKRLFSWIIFLLQSIFYIYFKYKKSNLYFVSNPPIFTFLPFLKNRNYSFLIYDIYPQFLVKNKLIKESSILFRIWNWRNTIVYENAKYIFTISEGMKQNLRYLKKHKDVKVVPIWTNRDFFNFIPKDENRFLKKINFKNEFLVAYSGNIGKSHPVEIIFDIAKFLVKEGDIKFLIIGEGEKKKQIKKLQKKLNLPNLIILDFQPTEIFPHVLSAFDLGVVTLELNSSDLSVPSKTFDLMAAGKPILSISSEDSELAKIISKSQIGKNFSVNDPIEKVASFIKELKENKKIYKKLSENSLKSSFDYSNINAKMLILN